MKVAFIGHRKIAITEELKRELTGIVENLILSEGADTFIFGSKSDFNGLSYEIVSELKEKYPHIRRIYVRAEYEYINGDYESYLLTRYEESFFPKAVHDVGSLSYIKRNEVMIDLCDELIVYYDVGYKPLRTNSGTEIAVEYANKRKKPVLNILS